MLIRLGTQTIRYAPLGDCESVKFEKRIAGMIASRLLHLADGRPLDLPATWLEVAEVLGCKVADFTIPRGGRGEYCPTSAGGGYITYNKAATAYMQARTLVHELAHHLLYVMGIVPWWEYQPAIRYEHGGLGGGWHMRHRLARRAERFVFGF